MSEAAKYFLDPKMSYALGLIVVFLLFHLIKPKPRHHVMPTLMFLFRDMGKRRAANFLRKLLTNLLFLLQLLILISIVVASAKPFMSVSKETLFKNTVLVLDTSSSMKAPFEGKTRFDEAIGLAKDNMGSVNTLILVKKIPQAVLVDESAGKVKDYLSKLSPTGSPTNLYAAISTAGSYAKPDSRIVVISDFIDTNTDTDLNTIKKTLESQGIKVDFIKVSSKVPNIGIVDLSVTDSKTTAVIRNYNSEAARVKLNINDLYEEISISPNSKEVFTFSTPPRTNKLEMHIMEGHDEFKEDNVAYISAPSDVKKRVLLITNNPDYKDMYIYNAMDVMKTADIEEAIPPKIPDLGSYDVFIFKDVNPNLILPGTFKGVKKEVEERGKSAIVIAQSNFLSVNYQGILPFIPQDLKKETTNILPTGGESITNSIDFGVTKKYFTVKPIEGRAISILVTAEDKTPLVVFNKLGAGNTIYYGVLDEDDEAESFFGKSPSYFVFWKRTLDFITNTPSVKNLNYKTGSYISFPEEQTIETPTGKVKTKDLLLDNQGLYTLKDRIVAINLANEKESDVSSEFEQSEEADAQSGERFKEKVPYEFTDYLLYAAIIILLLELLYIKMRGDF